MESTESGEIFRNIKDHHESYVFLVLLDTHGVIGGASLPDSSHAVPGDIIGKPFDQTIWWSYSGAVREQLQDAIKGAAAGSYLRCDIALLVGNDLVLSDFSIAPILDKNNAITTLIAYASTIDEHKFAESSVFESRQTYRDLVENINEAIFSVNESGIITYMSPVITSIAEYLPEDMVGHSYDEFLAPDDQEFGHNLYLKSREGIKQTSQVRMLTKSQHHRWVEIHSRPFFHRGKIARIDCALMDVTREHDLEAQLLQSQKLDSIGSLAGGVAHDFNNILAVLMGHVSLLEINGHDPEKRALSISAISKSVRRGVGIVEQLLTFARKSESAAELLDINVLINELATLLNETFPKQIQIEIDSTRKLPFVLGDSTQIHQVLLNLCINARDAMTQKGGKLRIASSMVAQAAIKELFFDVVSPEYVCVSVMDDGVGMTEATRLRIFEPFYSTKGTNGTGLGLATVKHIVERLKGFISVESQLGKGAVFQVYLPAQKP